MIKVTSENYTVEELDALMAFYRTSVGASAMKKGPAIAYQSNQLGSQWGLALITNVMDELYPSAFPKVS